MSIQDEVRQFHPSEPGATDPYGLYERMRETCPVARSDRASAVGLLGDVLGDGLSAVASAVDCSWVNGGARFMIQGVGSGLFVYQK